MTYRSLGALGLAAALAACVGSPGKLPLPAPTLVSSSPADGSTVGAVATVALTFSEPMNASSVAVVVTDGANAYDLGAPTWSDGGKAVTYAAPPSPLGHGMTYGITVDGKGTAGNAMEQKSFVFSVEAQPVVEEVQPAAGATAAAAFEPTITFNVAADRASTQIVVKDNDVSTEVQCLPLWSSDSKQVTCHHTAPLAFSHHHTIELAPGAKSAVGDAIDASGELPSAFTAAAGISPPVAARDISSDVATDNVTSNTSIVIAFDQPVDRVDAEARLSFSPAIPGSFGPWDATGTKMTWVPTAALPYGGEYTWTVAAGVREITYTETSTLASSGGFKVVKQGTASLPLVRDATGYVVDLPTGVCRDDNTHPNRTHVGDQGGNGPLLSFYTFDGTSLAGSAPYVNPAAAELSIYQDSNDIDDAIPLGTLYAQSLEFAGVLCDTPTSTARARLPTERSTHLFCFCMIGQPCNIDISCWYQARVSTSWTAGTTQTIQVGSTVSHQWAERADRANRIQFRLAFATGNNYTTYTTDGDNDQDLFFMSSPSLSVTYDYSW